MSEPNVDALERIADALCDDSPVDWDMEMRSSAEIAPRMAQLRALQCIAQAHRVAIAIHDAAATGPESRTVELSTRTVASSTSGAGEPFTWGPLRIQDMIDRGGFGEIYRAYDPSLQREVALKLLRPSRGTGRAATTRILEEARHLARIRHPNVLVVHGAAEHDGRAGIWTEFVRGESLQNLVAVRGALGAQEATVVGIELCRALAALHAASLVHRDVKAANVMRELGGRIVLMDFGSAVEHTHEDSPGRLEGTPIAMAPELLLFGAPPSPSSDIYSLGVLLYWLVSGRYPVEASDVVQLCEVHRRGGAVPLRDVRPDLPTGFVQVVERALDADPKRRYASVGEMERDLAHTSQMHPTPAPGSIALDSGTPGEPAGVDAAARGPVPGGRRRWRRQLRVAAAMAGAAVAVFVGVRVLAPRFLPLRVDVSLHRQGQGTAELLTPGSRTRPGDRLFLQIEGSRPMYVYVIDEDQQGQVFTLFPSGAAPHQPLAPRVRHRLPTDASGKAASWVVTNQGGMETILVVASTAPRADIESELQRYPRPLEGQGKSRGLGRLETEAGAANATHRIERLARSNAHDLRIWKIEVLCSGN